MINQLVFNGVTTGCVYCLTALGFAVVYRSVRFFHFAHGVVYAVGAYVAYATARALSSGVQASQSWAALALAFAAGIAVAAGVGLGIDRLVYRPLRERKAPGLIFLIASFGVFIFIQNLLQLIFGAQILTMRTGPVKEGHHVLGAVITDIQIVIVLVSLGVLVFLWALMKYTRLGKQTRAVADDSIAASVVGISSERTIMWVFLIGSALAGLAGILISYETNIEPTMGFNAILKGIIASIIGGMTIPGAALGGLLLGLVENASTTVFSSTWRDVAAFVLLVAFLLLRPQGILGRKDSR